MIPSVELEHLIVRLYEGVTNTEASTTAESLFSKQMGFIAIGTTADEWWQDSAAITQGYAERVKAGESRVIVSKIIAYQESSVGWVIDRVILKTPDGTEIPVRHTYIFHQEEGGWKIIHAHYSLDVLNEKF
jgi:ketosteroid isomerase-like protein